MHSTPATGFRKKVGATTAYRLANDAGTADRRGDSNPHLRRAPLAIAPARDSSHRSRSRDPVEPRPNRLRRPARQEAGNRHARAKSGGFRVIADDGKTARCPRPRDHTMSDRHERVKRFPTRELHPRPPAGDPLRGRASNGRGATNRSTAVGGPVTELRRGWNHSENTKNRSRTESGLPLTVVVGVRSYMYPPGVHAAGRAARPGLRPAPLHLRSNLEPPSRFRSGGRTGNRGDCAFVTAP